jgi:capsular exopolysaccharide synthesis family protein
MSDPSEVRFVEGVPQTATGPALQRAVLGSDHELAEEYRVLASKVSDLAADRFTTIGVVSAVPGEGKTTVALGLAAALARTNPHRVLLLEADLRQPSLERYLGLPRVSGVSDWLSGTSSNVPVRTISPPGFSVITAGRQPLQRSELIGSDRMATLLGACQLSFGFLVVDCPPLSPVADAVALQDLLDGFLLVVRARTAPRDVITRAVARLKEGRIQGVVFNGPSEILRAGYGPSYRHHYGRKRV